MLRDNLPAAAVRLPAERLLLEFLWALRPPPASRSVEMTLLRNYGRFRIELRLAVFRLAFAFVIANTYGIARSQPVPLADCRSVESERFIFHSDPWINLHHFLYQWARNVPERQPEDRRRAVEVTERDQLGSLDAHEREAWVRALDYYRQRLIAGDILFNRRLIDVREQLAVIACSGVGLDELDAEHKNVLDEAMRVYRSRWWPTHHEANVAWIQWQVDSLKVHETTLAERLAATYGGVWPGDRIRVDVAAYTNWAGAYTTNNPNHLTISGTDYTGLEGLEILFHEVSHASFFEQRILGQINVAFRASGTDPPDRLAHTIQFVTPAELLSPLLTDEELEKFQSVGKRVLERGSLREQYLVVLKHWKPFLDGQVERTEALDRIAQELSKTNRN